MCRKNYVNKNLDMQTDGDILVFILSWLHAKKILKNIRNSGSYQNRAGSLKMKLKYIQ
jgi:hypothetical protein